MANNIKPAQTTHLALVSLKHNRADDMMVEFCSADRTLVLNELESLSVERNKDAEPEHETFFRVMPFDGTQAASDAGLEAIKAGKAFTVLKEIKIGLEDFRVMVVQPWDGWFAEDVRVEYAGAYGPASFDVNTREPERIRDLCHIWRQGFSTGITAGASRVQR